MKIEEVFARVHQTAEKCGYDIYAVGGYVRDLTGDYAVVFACTIPLFAISALLLLLIRSPALEATRER